MRTLTDPYSTKESKVYPAFRLDESLFLVVAEKCRKYGIYRLIISGSQVRVLLGPPIESITCREDQMQYLGIKAAGYYGGTTAM
jgi:hypothetical protein